MIDADAVAVAIAAMADHGAASFDHGQLGLDYSSYSGMVLRGLRSSMLTPPPLAGTKSDPMAIHTMALRPSLRRQRRY